MNKRLIEKIKNRDEEAISKLIQDHSNYVYHLIKRIIGSIGTEEDVEECVSDSFIAVINDIDNFNEEKGKLYTFILIKAKYKALDYKRKLEKDKNIQVFIEEADIQSDEKNLEDRVYDRMQLRGIVKIINEFKEPDRTYFYLRYFMHYEVKEIANKFGVTAAAVENRLYRCRQYIRNIYKEEVI